MSALPEEFYKSCTKCRKEFEDRESFSSATTFVGIIETGKYAENNLELRNCMCGTTLASYFPKDPNKPNELRVIKAEPSKVSREPRLKAS